MSKDIPFDEKAVCDGCGTTGAFDLMGDFYCMKCLWKVLYGERRRDESGEFCSAEV